MTMPIKEWSRETLREAILEMYGPDRIDSMFEIAEGWLSQENLVLVYQKRGKHTKTLRFSQWPPGATIPVEDSTLRGVWGLIAVVKPDA